MALTETEFKAANRRGAETKQAGPTALSVRYDARSKRLVVTIGAGVDLVVDPKRLQGLESATNVGLKQIEISPSGLGLHFPLLNADIYLPALLESVMGSEKWITSAMGRRGGVVTSSAKSKAARENGKLGGRPKRKVS